MVRFNAWRELCSNTWKNYMHWIMKIHSLWTTHIHEWRAFNECSCTARFKSPS
ncbi:hypothetical protein F383_30706 [Gossypium arboreum]|uniref:Uncharacterized protein n=1 Tax=Gossypium arboreum TaxID=29729 RepID=A0A0B0PEK8_GOSAR|nr:hypothetical protein F383_30706 [Gossypium arboreum]